MRILALVLAAQVALFWPTAAGVAAAKQPQRQQRNPCCFKHPQYAGTCTVLPSRDESCGRILAFLNDPSSAGKSYCDNTTIRGGWIRVTCAPAPTQERQRP